MSKTHTATMLAWVSVDMLKYSAADLQSDDPATAISAASYYLTPDHPEERIKRWNKDRILIGRADITLVLDGKDKLADAQITSLRAEKASVLAEAQNEATNIERQIQTLLAIANEAQA